MQAANQLAKGQVRSGLTFLLLCAACSPESSAGQTTPQARLPSAGSGDVAAQGRAVAGTGSGVTSSSMTAASVPPVAQAPAQPMRSASSAAAGSTGMAQAGSPAAPAMPTPAAPSAPAAPMSMIPMATGESPKLPDIKGDCPEFKNGTIMVAGHKSIQITAGEPGKGGPLLFYWHGTGSSAAESARFPGNQEIIAAGGIVAAFNGSQSSKAGGDCSGTGAHNIADFDAADQIAACAVKNHGIDPRRIYATGCSAGGLQTGCMAMLRSSYLAAVAPNSGGIVTPQRWQDSHTPAVFTMHGGSSDMVIVTFSQTSASFDMQAKTHGGFVVNCDHGGGHCAAPADLQRSAWQFMKDHPWGAKSPWSTGIPMGVPAYCKAY